MRRSGRLTPRPTPGSSSKLQHCPSQRPALHANQPVTTHAGDTISDGGGGCPLTYLNYKIKLSALNNCNICLLQVYTSSEIANMAQINKNVTIFNHL